MPDGHPCGPSSYYSDGVATGNAATAGYTDVGPNTEVATGPEPTTASTEPTTDHQLEFELSADFLAFLATSAEHRAKRDAAKKKAGKFRFPEQTADRRQTQRERTNRSGSGCARFWSGDDAFKATAGQQVMTESPMRHGSHTHVVQILSAKLNKLHDDHTDAVGGARSILWPAVPLRSNEGS